VARLDSVPSLVVISDADRARQIPIPFDGLVLGRNAGLGPPFSTDQYVSRNHVSVRRRGDGVECRVAPELLLLSDPMAGLEGTSSAIRFDLDVFGLSIVEHNPGVEATAYGLLADFLRAVQS